MDLIFREIDSRESNRIRVTLEWNHVDRTLWVFVFDAEEPLNDRTICVEDHARAREAFWHPYSFTNKLREKENAR